MKFKNKKGFALTEVLLAIAVIVIIGIVAYPLYSNASRNAKIEKTVNDLTLLSQNVNKLYGTQHDYSSLALYNTDQGGMAKLDQLGLVPEGMGSNGTYIDAWNGSLSIYGLTPGKFSIGGMEGHTFISLSNIPHDACVPLATALITRLSVTYIYINGVGSLSNTDQLDSTIAGCQNTNSASSGTMIVALI